MSEIIIPNVISHRDKNYNYFLDKKNNLVRKKYNYFTDKNTYILLLIILLGFLYWSEVKTAREFIGDPCVEKCLIGRYVDNWNKLNPTIQVNCDDKGRCQYSGVMNDELRKFNDTLMRLNYSLYNG